MPPRGAKGKGSYEGSSGWKTSDSGYDGSYGTWKSDYTNESGYDGSYGSWKSDYRHDSGHSGSYSGWKNDYRNEDRSSSGRKGGGKGKGRLDSDDANDLQTSWAEVEETSEGKRPKGKDRKANGATRQNDDVGDDGPWNAAKDRAEKGGRRGKGGGVQDSRETSKEGHYGHKDNSWPLNSNAPHFTPQSYSYGSGYEGDAQYWEWQSAQQQQQQTSMPLWTQYEDNDGMPYYYNSKTGLCQWERPTELDPPKTLTNENTSGEKSRENVGGNRRDAGAKDTDKDETRRGGGGGNRGGDGDGGGRQRGGGGAGAGGGGGGGGCGGGGGGSTGAGAAGEGGEGGGGRGNRGRRRAKVEDPAAKKEACEFGPPGCNLFVFHLPDDWGDDDLHEYFAPHGNVVSAKVMKELGTGRSRGFGFVSYEDRVSAATAIKKMQGYKILGKRLKVEFKKGEQEGSKGDSDDRGDFLEDDEGLSKKTYPDDERLIGYLRAISAKNVVQSLKESENAGTEGFGSENGGDEPGSA